MKGDAGSEVPALCIKVHRTQPIIGPDRLLLNPGDGLSGRQYLISIYGIPVREGFADHRDLISTSYVKNKLLCKRIAVSAP